MNTYCQRNITSAAALGIAQRAIEIAVEKRLSIAVSVCDASGREIIFLRSDNTPIIADLTAKKKAKFAIGFKMPTGDQWYQFIKDDPILLRGVEQLPDFILLGGGSPIMENNEVIGAIGVSGGHYKQDEEIVSLAIKDFK